MECFYHRHVHHVTGTEMKIWFGIVCLAGTVQWFLLRYITKKKTTDADLRTDYQNRLIIKIDSSDLLETGKMS